nr:Rho termination factor N-terminal domain-containing protein [Planctomycetota bacterium]
MNRDDLKSKSVAELRSLAAEHKIPGRSKLRKAQLIEALADLQPRQPAPMRLPDEVRPVAASSSMD